jgi:UDP-N-acetyl-D-glucosamine dehydrogenase
MPAYVASRIAEALNDASKSVRGSTILVLGVAYKPDVGDIRESPSIAIINHLQKRGAKVRFHDPFVDAIQVNGSSLQRSELTRAAVTAADCVAMLTPHARYDLNWIAEHAQLVFDARNAYASQHQPRVKRL